ncbi:hypothetical protein OH799_23635 [Nocardia sp. NBC_00881]|uniref:hypothetical protein n=1 Tax=Nocardia sp. NBC_00881 TaxID=2975995 RepID=UPI00386E940E|nr:hypothetical protein OH799_23635 [Nocardia sp. NBC_00881]
MDSHPAVTAAIDALADADKDLTPVTAIIRDEIVASVIDGAMGRWIVFALPCGRDWVVTGTTYGAPRPAGPRADRTPNYLPLQRMGTRFRQDDTGSDGWYAVTGLAALDAVSVAVASELEESVVPIGEHGLAFTVVRASSTEDPIVYVHTSDGRRVSASLPQAG